MSMRRLYEKRMATRHFEPFFTGECDGDPNFWSRLKRAIGYITLRFKIKSQKSTNKPIFSRSKRKCHFKFEFSGSVALKKSLSANFGQKMCISTLNIHKKKLHPIGSM